MRRMVRVELGPRSYDIRLVTGEGPGAAARAASAGSLALVVSDPNCIQHARAVAVSLQDAGFRTESVILTPGEERKSLESASQLYDTLAGMRADRKTLVVPVGGGVIGDLAGFVAATFARGLPLFMVPTTLLAMVDSSVGGKVGINHRLGKNLIGAFHQPVGVWIDTATLDTLPEREFRSGLAEVVKYGVILDAAFFSWLEANTGAILRRDPAALRHLIGRCCRLKADVVEKDERETTGLRAVLNYGHTFGHALETVAGYGSWLHGEAVAMGMACAARLAKARGLCDVVERQSRLLEAFGLPTALPPLDADALIAAMRSDKKAEAGRLRFVLPVRLGEVRLFDASGDEARAALGGAS
ncbi:MAG: 3-dehydroquinate synthase [Gemmataceae bacterium]|nr:3-dehydroquinate synthase [Gemmataceae bacterium]